jgi:hypothetical protein
MTYFPILGAITLLAALASQPALSQDASSSASASPSAASGEPNSAPSGEPERDNYAELLAALEAGETGVDLSIINPDTAVDIVAVSMLELNGNSNELDGAIEKARLAIDQLRTDLATNAVLSSKITEAGFAIEDVVAVAVDREGIVFVTVFLDDRT